MPPIASSAASETFWPRVYVGNSARLDLAAGQLDRDERGDPGPGQDDAA